MREILVAGPNLSLDRTIAVEELTVGRIHRTGRRDARGGGKGANVVRALGCMGFRVDVAGFRAGVTGAAIATLLADEGVRCHSIEVAGESRSCLTVLAPGSITVFNEEGPRIDDEAWDRFVDVIEARLPHGGVFVCSGSWPPGAPEDAAARLVRLAAARSCYTICDTSKGQLQRVLQAGPDLIKPNVAEALSVLDPHAPPEPADEARGALDRAEDLAVRLLDLGPPAVVCSAGSQGAVLAQRGMVTRFPPIPVEVVNPVGAGDAMVAGIAAHIASGDRLAAAVAWGTAAAAAACETFPAGLLDRDRAAALLACYEASSSAI